MDDRTSCEGQFWHRCNITLTERDYRERTAGYRITHVLSGRVYMGWVGDAWHGLRLIATRLAGGSFPNVELQELVNTDARCELEVFRPDHHLPQSDQEAVLRDLMDTWAAQAGSKLIPNGKPLPAKRGEFKPPKPKKPHSAPKQVRTNSKAPWRNVAVVPSLHSGEAAFQLKHVKSGQVFVGSSCNLYESLAMLGHKLRKGTAPGQSFQQRYAEEPVFELTFELIDPNLPRTQRSRNAVELAKRWLQELSSDAEMITKARVPQSETSSIGALPRTHKLPKGGEFMRKLPGELKIPPKDMLHQAWFGGGL